LKDPFSFGGEKVKWLQPVKNGRKVTNADFHRFGDLAV
jgi:hypothetical protein